MCLYYFFFPIWALKIGEGGAGAKCQMSALCFQPLVGAEMIIMVIIPDLNAAPPVRSSGKQLRHQGVDAGVCLPPPPW